MVENIIEIADQASLPAVPDESSAPKPPVLPAAPALSAPALPQPPENAQDKTAQATYEKQQADYQAALKAQVAATHRYNAEMEIYYHVLADYRAELKQWQANKRHIESQYFTPPEGYQLQLLLGAQKPHIGQYFYQGAFVDSLPEQPAEGEGDGKE